MALDNTLRQIDLLRHALIANEEAKAEIARLEAALTEEKAKVETLTNAIGSVFKDMPEALVVDAEIYSANIVEDAKELPSETSHSNGNRRQQPTRSPSTSASDPFVCEVCARAFHTFANLRSHQRVHAAPSFICPICRQAYSTQGYLKRHTNLRHARADADASSSVSDSLSE
jgi:hypothetical protein